MRGFALLLVFVNLCFLGWAQFVDVPEEERRAAIPEDNSAPRLLLANERPEHAANNKTEPSAPAEPASPADRAAVAANAALKCVSIGPYQDLAGASMASAALQDAGFNARQRIVHGEVWVGYWVSVADLPSQAKAEEAMAKLKAGGVTDVYILPGNGPARVLSLGIFSEVARAQRRVDEARKLGFEPQVSDRKREGSVYWIDVDLQEPGQTLDPALLQSQGTIVRLEQRPCPTAG